MQYGVLAQLVERNAGSVEVIGSNPLHSKFAKGFITYRGNMTFIHELSDPGSDPIFGLQTEYKEDKREGKINLTIGVYTDEDGKPPAIMRALKKAEEQLLKQETTKNYLGIAGDEEYLTLTAKIVFGDIDQEKIIKIQSVGGTSALRTGFEFLKKSGFSHVSVSDPTWANHHQILSDLEYKVVTYPHKKAMGDFSIYTKHLHSLPEKSVVLLQAKCHNPTGIDFTKEQWMIVSEICKTRKFFPLFDSAYGGFAHSLEEDVWAIQYFVKQGHDLIVAHSYSKSFAIYNERVGALFAVIQDKNSRGIVMRNLLRLVRVNYSNPPAHGSSAIKTVLKTPELYKLWVDELSQQRNRINAIRKRLSDELKSIFDESVYLQTRDGSGFFCELPLTHDQINRMKKEFGIYITDSGRISLPGLLSKHFQFVIDSLKKVKQT